MISMFTLGSDLQEIEVIRSALSEEGTLVIVSSWAHYYFSIQLNVIGMSFSVVSTVHKGFNLI